MAPLTRLWAERFMAGHPGTAVTAAGGGTGEGIRALIAGTVDGVAPSAATVRDGSYPLARYLFLYTARPSAGAVKRFVDWVLSPRGQRAVADAGYVPIWGE
jgi:ABC-type phosphate transport system substrate-binding protein